MFLLLNLSLNPSLNLSISHPISINSCSSSSPSCNETLNAQVDSSNENSVSINSNHNSFLSIASSVDPNPSIPPSLILTSTPAKSVGQSSTHRNEHGPVETEANSTSNEAAESYDASGDFLLVPSFFMNYNTFGGLILVPPFLMKYYTVGAFSVHTYFNDIKMSL